MPTARAVVDDQPGVARQQLIPKGVETRDVLDFGHAHAIGGICHRQQLGHAQVIEILAVAGDSAFANQVRDQVRYMAAGFRNAQIDHEVDAISVPRRYWADEPVGVLPNHLCILEGPLRFEP